jgi:hypothetical protein
MENTILISALIILVGMLLGKILYKTTKNSLLNPDEEKKQTENPEVSKERTNKYSVPVYQTICSHCNEQVNTQEHNCSKLNRTLTQTDDGFLTSMLIGYMTESSIAGGLIGGNFTGAMIGSLLSPSHSEIHTNSQFNDNKIDSDKQDKDNNEVQDTDQSTIDSEDEISSDDCSDSDSTDSCSDSDDSSSDCGSSDSGGSDCGGD